MNGRNKSPLFGGEGAGDYSSPDRGGGSASIIAGFAPLVKSDPRRLLDQAGAAELRALASAAWHRERAGRYLAWTDNPWCAAQYDGHVREAAYQEAIAARHRQVRAALGEVRP